MIVELCLYLLMTASLEVAGGCDEFHYGSVCPFYPPSNIIADMTQIQTPLSCQNQCSMIDECSYFSWVDFTDDVAHCILYESCATLTECGTDCLSAISGPVSPTIDEACCVEFTSRACDAGGLLDVKFNLLTREDCQHTCQRTQDCAHWTFQPAACMLYSSCNSTQSCDICTSGPAFPFVSSCEDQKVGEHILVMGGECDGETYCSTIELITENLVCSPEMPELPKGRQYAEAVYQSGKVLVCGGYDNVVPTYHIDCFSYNIAEKEGAWVAEPSMIYPKRMFGMAEINGKVYTTGGYGYKSGSASQQLSTVESFTWGEGWKVEEGMELPSAWFDHCSVAVDGTLFVIGGQTGANRVMSFDVSLYQSLNETVQWVTEAITPVTSVYGHSCVVTSFEGQRGILVTGGTSIANVQFFVLEARNWRIIASLTEYRHEHTLNLINGVPYVAGGYASSNALTPTIEVFDGFSWAKSNNLKVGRRYHTGVSIPVGYLTCKML